jgi:hypothetical protein
MWHFEQKNSKERQEEQQHLANMAVIVRSFQEVNTQPGNKKGISPAITMTMTTSSSQQGSGACDCSVCFEELDSAKNKNNNSMTGSSRGSLPHVGFFIIGLEKSMLQTLQHATVCLDCAVRIWSNIKTCPICKAAVTTKPEAIYW